MVTWHVLTFLGFWVVIALQSQKATQFSKPRFCFSLSSSIWVFPWWWQQSSERTRRELILSEVKELRPLFKETNRNAPTNDSISKSRLETSVFPVWCMYVCFILRTVALFIGLWLVLSQNQLLHWLDWQYCLYALPSHSGHPFSSFQQLAFPWQFTWPPVPNQFLLNWSGRHNTTHNKEQVFVYCTETDGKKCLTL